MKRLFLIAVSLIILFNGALASAGDTTASEHDKLLEKEYSLDVIVIDPGHGGSDVGAIAKNGLYEKDVTIKVATKLKQIIEKNLKIKVYLTREKGQTVFLKRRTRIANKMDADLFLSIHANASEYVSISGCETFFYEKDASDEQAKLLAELENRGAMTEDDEPEDPLEFILMDMAKSELIALSYNFAEVIQKEYVKSVKSRDRGVKQAPFTVLEGLKMPAVLTEIGFISSKGDAKRLKDDKYLDGIIQALYKSVKKYKEITDIKSGKVKGKKGK